jgi:chorismate mutase
VRGIRGAITVEENSKTAILEATKELTLAIIERNQLQADTVASIFITSTADLTAAFPAAAVRTIAGWEMVPLMGAQEVDVPGGLPCCIRMLFHVNDVTSTADIHHVYLRDAVRLRPDLKGR